MTIEQLHQATVAGYKFRESLMPDAKSFDGCPLWHGWAIARAFEAGAEWERKQAAKRRKRRPRRLSTKAE